MIILFQINFYKTLGLRISKDLYIRNITKTISNYKSFEDHKRKIENHGFQRK